MVDSAYTERQPDLVRQSLAKAIENKGGFTLGEAAQHVEARTRAADIVPRDGLDHASTPLAATLHE